MVDLKGVGDQAAPAAGGVAISPETVSGDWITIWQSELSALATDRERQEIWSRVVALWANTGQALAHLFHSQFMRTPEPAATADHDEAGSAAPAPPSGPPSAMAASGSAGAESDRRQLAQLAERVAELERQLAERDRSTERPTERPTERA